MSKDDKKMHNETKDEYYEEISLFKNPINTVQYLIMILSEQFFRFLKFLITNRIILMLAITYGILNFIQGPFKEVLFKHNFSTSA